MDAYKRAGVDVEAGKKFVDTVKRISNNADLGGFGGMFPLNLAGVSDPVLVSGTDGVGTKLLVALEADKHDTIGIDLVAMCVNDVLAQGAKPLFFLDYLGIGQLVPEKAAKIVAGVEQGCELAGCSLIGGETAEMPDMYSNGHYDLAGFSVGIADKSKLVDGSQIEPGDAVIGLPSSGLHSNGFSLVRDVLFKQQHLSINDVPEGLETDLGEELLKPTQIYVKQLMPLFERKLIAGAAHITGGGIADNLGRVIPAGLTAKLERSSWQVPAIMRFIQSQGNLSQADMDQTFNLGIGFILVVHEKDEGEVLQELESANQPAFKIGHIVKGEDKVELSEVQK
ncbi:phosphoribosylformylglycinamidine cyclo-ligase [Lentilactobacillus curieae]|uniref:Phosphoribosylformylglycinamidine cyclo-ligase n=1 Tax=Lentilactobacillus curieae TaxID=1138822 RepID=A0A1S6QHD1_9LACO|nr:phosphoribosylformylglycinamidine cyclo-ligase [Lentilactobacillus curieae]AQW21026.1 phosphoribosylformylglycinamidine cyclo-ligase [Lentilactobacillus curieae]